MRGFDGVGVDLSRDLLDLAAKRKDIACRLIRCDARCLPFESVFDLTLNLFTSFGYFEDPLDDQQQLCGMVRSLRPGGQLVLDLANRAHLETQFKPFDHQHLDGLSIENHRTLTDTHIIKKSIVTTADGQRHDFVEKVRLYTPTQITEASRAAGLSDVHIHGSLEGVALDAQSPRMVVVGRRS